MKYGFAFLGLLVSFVASSQSLRDINYNYLYNPSELTFDLKPVRHSDHWMFFYKLQLRDTTAKTDEFTIQWQSRESLTVNEGALPPEVSVTEAQRNSMAIYGSVKIPIAVAPKILVAKVVNSAINRTWLFYKALEPEYPVNNYLLHNGEAVLKPFVKIGDALTMAGSERWIVSFYNDNFPTASPPFAEAQARVNRSFIADSTFSLSGGENTNFSLRGLYLIQKDTNTAEGIALRAEDDYPRIAKIQSLAAPLVYVCTQAEYDRLLLAKGDKKAIDRVILNITTDTERARKFMRNYFRRVELANQYFSSYKEGWKTDRGMIYVIFGLPDEVFKFSDREVWTYKNDEFKVTFNFSKASSIFDPDNYVLIREKKYQQTWYEVIDLWRNARF